MLVRVLMALDSVSIKRRVRQIVSNAEDAVGRVLRGRPPRWEKFFRESGDILIVSRSLIPEDIEGAFQLLSSVPDAPKVVVLTLHEDPEDQARLLAAGFLAILSEDLEDETLGEALEGLLSTYREESLAKQQPPQVLGDPRLSDFISSSVSMQAFMAIVEKVSTADVTLLILGETGVGKERLAQAIHAEGPRSDSPFIAINCGAIPEALLESELFGHEAGAFTGATRARRGWFELAHRGTIFLDEVAEMPLHLQVKLLRVLQNREVLPVGAEKPILVDVRVMAATNRDLEEEVAQRRFRQDLFYRLSVMILEIPPLRERQEDIPELVDRYIQYFQSKFPTSVTGVSNQALSLLVQHSWPGNVRELVNVIERAMLLCPNKNISVRDLPIKSTQPVQEASMSEAFANEEIVLDPGCVEYPLKTVRQKWVQRIEKIYLDFLLTETQGRIDLTARRAGLNPRNLYDKLRKYGIKKENYRGQE